MSRFSRLGYDLYEGHRSVDFIGRRWQWYAFSAVLVLVALYGLAVPKLNLGIEFEGGVEYRVAMGQGQATDQVVEDVREAVAGSGIENAEQPTVNTSGRDNIRIQTEPLTTDQADQVTRLIQEETGVAAGDISQESIGPSWGRAVAERALIGLGVFLVLVVLLIWGYFREWKMSVAALVALAHDLVITIGVYALSRFEVTPATVTGVLTILGFSLYDTVVVFDKVRENTKDLARSHKTYAEAANLAVNQTLVRSINTSVVALLPVGALLYVGAFTLGSGSLKDLALALFVGMAAGAYSSIFIATPLLVQLKEREARVKAGDARATRHQARQSVDRFADVPVFTEDMPIASDPGEESRPSRGSGATAVGAVRETGRGTAPEPGGNRPVPPGPPGRVTAGERPAPGRPVADSTSAGRPQPTRKPRSQRGKR